MRASVLAALAASLACKPPLPPEPPELDPDEHLLLTPRGNPEDLLGRRVEIDPHGGVRIADERPPGCTVAVRKIAAQWSRRYQQELGRVAQLDVGDRRVAQLQAKYGKSVRMEAAVDNVEVLEADLTGCGGDVVKSVKVGTGTREIKYAEELGGSASASVKGTPVGASGRRWKDVERASSWTTPQAWAFTVQRDADGEAIRLDPLLPTRVKDGDPFEVSIGSNRRVYLVLLYRTAQRVAVVFPTMQTPELVVGAGERLRLPPGVAKLANPSEPSHESFVIYAFAEEGDFHGFKPPLGALSDEDAARYLEGLPERLRAIPLRRWSSTTIHYVIEPRESAP